MLDGFAVMMRKKGRKRLGEGMAGIYGMGRDDAGSNDDVVGKRDTARWW